MSKPGEVSAPTPKYYGIWYETSVGSGWFFAKDSLVWYPSVIIARTHAKLLETQYFREQDWSRYRVAEFGYDGFPVFENK